MEANMSGLKRRFNKAIVECRSQARFTARRLAGRIRTIDRRPRNHHPHPHPHQQQYPLQQQQQQQQQQVDSQAGLRVHLRHRALNESRARQFRYSFAPMEIPLQINEQNSSVDSAGENDHDYDDEDNDDFELVVQNENENENRLENEKKTDQNDTHFLKHLNKHNDNSNLVDEQQVEEGFLSEEEQDLSSSATPAVIIKSPPIRTLETIRARENKMAGNMKTMVINKSPPQVFVRCGSRRRSSSRRRRSGRAPRQVRFQPIPQSIDISNHEESFDNELFRPQDDNQRDGDDDGDGDNHQQEVNYKNEMPRFIVSSVKKYRRVHLSAKPLTKKLNQLSHVKFNKIKLKSFNNLAHQIHQTLTTSSYAPSNLNSTKKVPNQSSSLSSSLDNQQQHNNLYQQQQQAPVESNAAADDDFGWGSDFDEQSLDSSLASQCDKSQTMECSSYLLEMGKSSCDFRAINDVIQDQGISGQFKRIDPNQSLMSSAQVGGGSSVNPSTSSSSVPPSPPRRSDSSGAMKQDKGLLINKVDSGKQLRDEFKQRQKQCEEVIRNSLKMVEKPDSHLNDDDSDGQTASRQAEGEQPPAADSGGGGGGKSQVISQAELGERENGRIDEDDHHDDDDDDDDDDDEESLKSLEARQGFRQIRDKLKIILDQRLANYERSFGEHTGVECTSSQADQTSETAMPPSNQTCPEKAGQHKEVTCPPEVAPAIDIHQRHVKTTSEFDCQSHCSDESGSSSGLDSNHSGSQDSGHSTQHSGYSSHSCGRHHLDHHHHHHHHHHDHLSPSIETDSPTDGSPSAQSASPSSPVCRKIVVEPAKIRSMPATPAAPKPAATSATKGKPQNELLLSNDESNERRIRFAQNRLIINSKLESIFKNHQPQTSPLKDKQQPGSSPSSSSSSSSSSPGNKSVSQSVIKSKLCKPDNLPAHLDVETRRRLLEQQRQMSLKLKQKPRRKSAKRALLNPSSAQQVDSDQATEDNGSYVSNSSELNRCNSIRRHANGRESLTKQLSMICLRQAGNHQMTPAQQQHQHLMPPMNLTGVYQPSQPQYQMISGEQTLPRAAQSLRQLVKDVIDDCERPNKLSALTMSILNRSDSLSSDLATSADEATGNSADLAASLPSERCTSSLGSLKTPLDGPQTGEAHQEEEEGEDRYAASSGSPSRQNQLMSPQPIGYIHPIKHSTPQRQLAQQVADMSMSSVGSIDGLEYSRGGQTDLEEPASNERSEENRAAKSTLGSYLKSLRDFSRLKLTKVKLMNAGNPGESVQRKQQRDLLNHRSIGQSVGRKLAPCEQNLFELDLGKGGSGYNYEYQLDHHDRQQQQQQQQPEGLNTLAGNWRRRARRTSIIQSPMMMAADDMPSAAKGDNFANHFVTISNRKWKSCNLRTSLMQIAFNGFNANEHKPAGGSPIGASKQHLAYLDNSKNFTDEDNY